jgi:hypothetical protein
VLVNVVVKVKLLAGCVYVTICVDTGVMMFVTIETGVWDPIGIFELKLLTGSATGSVPSSFCILMAENAG